MEQKHVQHPDRAFGNPDRRKRIEVHEARLDILDTTLAQCVQRALGGPDHALRTDGAVELVFDLQQAGCKLPIVVTVADSNRLVRRIGFRERLLQRCGVTRKIVVAHGERGLRVALVAQLAHAQ
jgi:hypothetical protein